MTPDRRWLLSCALGISLSSACVHDTPTPVTHHEAPHDRAQNAPPPAPLAQEETDKRTHQARTVPEPAQVAPAGAPRPAPENKTSDDAANAGRLLLGTGAPLGEAFGASGTSAADGFSGLA